MIVIPFALVYTAGSSLRRAPSHHCGMVRDAARYGFQTDKGVGYRSRNIVVGPATQRFVDDVDLYVCDRWLHSTDEGTLANQTVDSLRPTGNEIGG